jgi:hypothetical protein
VDLSKSTDTDGFAEVDVAGDRSGPDIEPIDGLRGKFLGGARLDRVDPT